MGCVKYRFDFAVTQFLSQVCAELRKDYPDGLPIIMLSANGDENSLLRGLEVKNIVAMS